MITTTLKKIRQHRPCGLGRGSGSGYDLLRKTLGKGYGDNTPIKFSQIIESNGLDDALWCLRSICPKHEKDVRLFAADCAERVLCLYEKDYPDDTRVRDCINAVREFANGKISQEELARADAARADAARAAAGAAAWAAADAADAAAWAAAAAARAARAAWTAAAWAAAADAADAADAAAWAAADDAARVAERKFQTEMLIERFG